MTNRKRSRTRRYGTNPRAQGTNERATARNKWALRNWKRKRQNRARPDAGNLGEGSQHEKPSPAVH
jgi:hypothetical protein